jgi:hypothetical protein
LDHFPLFIAFLRRLVFSKVAAGASGRFPQQENKTSSKTFHFNQLDNDTKRLGQQSRSVCHSDSGGIIS